VSDVARATDQARLLGASVLVEPREGPAGWRSVVAARSPGEVAFRRPEGGGRSAGLGGRQDDHRDRALGLALVLGELRDALGLRAIEALAFLAGSFAGEDVERVGADLDRDVGVGLEV